MKLLVVIPAYNEEEALPLVLEQLKETCPPEYDFLVVNDGSTDGTANVCRNAGCKMLDLPANLGLAGAFQAGMLYACTKDYDAVIQFDADGQHLASYIEPMAKKLQEGCDIVIGSRFYEVKKPIGLRTAGSFLISFAMRFTTGHRICDPTSGMRIFNRAMVKEFASNLNYAPEPDTISYLLRNGATICEVQVQMQERQAGTSYLNAVRSIRYMVEMAVSILLIQWFRKRKGGQAT